MNSNDLRQLGKYPIVGEIGRGGMAVVYKGWDPDLGRPVAIKVLLDNLAADPEFVRRFRNEARMAGQLQHPNIVTIHDVGSQETPSGIKHFMVMEFLEGVSLDQVISQHGPLSLQAASQVVEQVAAALEAARGREVVHRDVKPANIMVLANGQVKLMDFGLVRAGEGTNLTRVGQIMGTPEYMAPEQARGEPIDPRTDIYSLGIVLYKMLSGRSPFVRSDPYATLYAHVTEPLQFDTALLRNLPRGVKQVILKATAKSRAERYQSASAFAAELLKVANVQPGRRLALGFVPVQAPPGVGSPPGVGVAVRRTPPPPAGGSALQGAQPTAQAGDVRHTSEQAGALQAPAQPPRGPSGPATGGPASGRSLPIDETRLIQKDSSAGLPPPGTIPAVAAASGRVPAPGASASGGAGTRPAPTAAGGQTRSDVKGGRPTWAFVLISLLVVALVVASVAALSRQGGKPPPAAPAAFTAGAGASQATRAPARGGPATAGAQEPAATYTPFVIVATKLVVATQIVVVTSTPEPFTPTMPVPTPAPIAEADTRPAPTDAVPASPQPPTPNEPAPAATQTQMAASVAKAAGTSGAATRAAGTAAAASRGTATSEASAAQAAKSRASFLAPVLLAPAEDASVFGATEFRWTWNGPALGENQGFELRIWREGQGHWGAHEAVRTTSVTTDVGAGPNVKGVAGPYFWTVAVVGVNPYDANLGPEAAPRRINIQTGGGSGGSGGGQACPPGGC